MTNELLKKYNRTKYLKLLSAIVIDIVGLLSYSIPVFGESGDMIWGPISGLLIFLLFPHQKKMAIMGVVEELIPLTDFVPTACIAWVLDYVKDNKKTLSDFGKRKVGEEQIVNEILNKNNIDSRHFLE
jgi:hypothetical protein